MGTRGRLPAGSPGFVTGHSDPSEGLARFLLQVGRLKRTPRTGWLDRGVPELETESVADHSFRVALLAWLAAAGDPALDRDRVLKLALIHDLAEAITGDLTPYDPGELVGLDAEARSERLNRRLRPSSDRAAAKREAEAEAITSILANLPADLNVELAELWQELQERETAEGRFVKDADRLETYLQSREYAAVDPSTPVESFALEVTEMLEHPAGVALRHAIDQAIDDPAK